MCVFVCVCMRDLQYKQCDMNCALLLNELAKAGGQYKRGEGGEGVRGGKETEGVEYFSEVTQ